MGCVILQENLQEKIEEKSRIEAILQSKTEELSASLKDKNLEIVLEDEKKILIRQKAEVVEDLNMLKKELEEKNAKISSIEAGNPNIINFTGVEQSYRCESCGSTFTRIDNLKRHIQLAHSKEKVTFDCQYYGKSFDRKWNLNRHVQM